MVLQRLLSKVGEVRLLSGRFGFEEARRFCLADFATMLEYACLLEAL